MAVWRYICDDRASDSFGLAADEYLMGGYGEGLELKPPTLRLYTYQSHCVLVGRFQSVEAEVSQMALCFGGRVPYPEGVGLFPQGGSQVSINRRPTGGGTIIMGEGQLGVAVVAAAQGPDGPLHPQQAFEEYSRGLVQGLSDLGIQAHLRPKNDLEVGGRKIAGLGVYYDERGALLFHASLLVDLDVRLMLSLLNVPVEKISDKEIASFEDRITTVNRELGGRLSTSQVRERIREGFKKAFGIDLEPKPFSPEELEGIRALEQGKYLTEEWVYQRSPTPDMVGGSIQKTRAGLIRVRVALAGEVIKSVLVSGDFFSTSPTIAGLESRLKWSAADRESIRRAIEEEFSSPERYIYGLAPEELADSIVAAVEDARAKARV